MPERISQLDSPCAAHNGISQFKFMADQLSRALVDWRRVHIVLRLPEYLEIQVGGEQSSDGEEDELAGDRQLRGKQHHQPCRKGCRRCAEEKACCSQRFRGEEDEAQSKPVIGSDSSKKVHDQLLMPLVVSLLNTSLEISPIPAIEPITDAASSGIIITLLLSDAASWPRASMYFWATK